MCLKRAVLLGLFLLFALTSAFTAKVEWKWNSSDEKVKYFRYQLNSEEEGTWTVIDSTNTRVFLETSSGDVLYVQASYDGIHWSDSSYERYLQLNHNSGLYLCTPIEWMWSSTDESIKYYRYQRDKEDENNWQIVDACVNSVKLVSHMGINTFYLQASRDGNNWTESTIGTYKRSCLSLRVNLAPYSSAVFDFYNSHDIEEARTLMGTTYGASTSIELDWYLLDNLRVYPEVGYSFVLKAQTVIPKQYAVHYIKAGGGIDYLVGITEKTNLYAGLFGYGIVDINNTERSNPKPYFGVRCGFETKIADALYIGAMARVTAGLYIIEKDSLYNSITLLIDPASISLRYEF